MTVADQYTAAVRQRQEWRAEDTPAARQLHRDQAAARDRITDALNDDDRDSGRTPRTDNADVAAELVHRTDRHGDTK